MSKALEYIKAALQIAFGVIVLAIILLNFHGLNLASQKFLETASVSKIQLPGVEIDMDAAGVEQALSSVGANYLTVADKSRIQAQIHGLDAKEFVRLMYVGQLKDLCEFETPSTEMRNDVALDYGLRDKGLTKIESNLKLLDSVRAALAKKVADGKTLDNGYPRTCYDMTLTDDGYNVKTALIHNLSLAFNAGRGAAH